MNRWSRPLRALCLVVLPLSAVAAQAEMDEARLESTFREAIAAFEEGNRLIATDESAAQAAYEKATLRLEQVIREGGVENGKLYYNLGNIWFQRGDLGRAILNYRRAERYMPNNINLRQNLAFVRQQRRDAFQPTETKKILTTVFFWHYDLPSGVRVGIFAAAFVGFWGLAAVRLFRRHGGLHIAMAAAALVAVPMFVSLTVEARYYATHPAGVILAPETVGRKGDGDTYQPSFAEPLHAGTEFIVLEDRGDWVQASLPDERTCWLPRKDIGLINDKL